MIEEGSNGGKGHVAKKTVKKILKIQRNKLMQDFEAAKFEGLGGEQRRYEEFTVNSSEAKNEVQANTRFPQLKFTHRVISRS